MKASLTYASTFSIVRSEILEGHGVEDIAIKHGVKLDDVQRQVLDHSTTYIIDGNFKRLFYNNKGLFPTWFRKSIRGMS
jgi:hypothetical protein